MKRTAQPWDGRGRDVGRVPRAVEREREGSEGGGGREDGEGNSGRVGQVGDELPHLLQGVPLHQNIVLGKQQRRNFTEFPH